MNRKLTLLLGLLLIFVTVALAKNYFISSDKHLNSSFRQNQSQADNQFFEFRKAQEELSQKPEEASLIIVGDISFSRGVERIIKAQKNINYPFFETQDYLQGGNIVFGNLESPITSGREILDQEMIFRSNPDTERALKGAGFSLLSLANNHTPDFGEQGLKDTLQYLEKSGLQFVGAGRNSQEAYQPVYIEIKGIKFAFLAYVDPNLVPRSYEAGERHAGTAFMKVEKLTEAIKQAKQKADFVIVSMHAGNEYTSKPNNLQINFAHLAIDAGASLVIGHHPHVVQKMEKYKDKYIFYSLGNFVFDQMWSYETREGLVAKVFFDKLGVVKIEVLPVFIENFSQPKFLDGESAQKALEKLKIDLNKRMVFAWNQEKQTFDQDSRRAIFHRNQPAKAKIKKLTIADLNKNSLDEEYYLENGSLKISQSSKTLWQSPSDWWIDDFVLADSTNNGVVNINLSVWKPGSFGQSKPFWVEENDMSIKNHFFVFSLENEEVKPIWQSSNLAIPNCEFLLEDIDGDNKNELVVIEGNYNDEFCQGKYVAVWQWNNWGFFNQWRSQEGQFSNLSIEEINREKLIVVDGG